MKTFYVSPVIINNIRKENLISALKEYCSNNGWRYIVYGTQKPKKEDVICIWNRHLNQDQMAKSFEEVGAKVFCFENPYIDIPDYFSVGFGYHNSMENSLPCLDEGERFKSFNKEIKPWNKNGKNVLIITQSKIWNEAALGLETHRQPPAWDSLTLKVVARTNHDRHIIFRCHPKCQTQRMTLKGIEEVRNQITEFATKKDIKMTINISLSDGQYPLKTDLENAGIVITHASNSVTEALLEGVPIFTTAPFGPYTRSLGAVGTNIANIVYPDNREEVFNRMAWAQFNVNEISNGFMFDKMMNECYNPIINEE